ncbi:MAG: hypothetical protein ACRCUY_11775 [Thermoguttaceae bacterium]
MFALAIFPLGFYFFLLAWWHSRRFSIVLSGYQDTMLIAAVLAGLIALGPGRLIIPLDVMMYWGVQVWIFVGAFYYLVATYLAKRWKYKLIIYNPPNCESLLRSIDPESQIDGNVVILPHFQLQCLVSETNPMTLQSTQRVSNWDQFEAAIRKSSLTQHPNGEQSQRDAICLAALGLLIFIFCITTVLRNFPQLCEKFADLWGCIL